MEGTDEAHMKTRLVLLFVFTLKSILVEATDNITSSEENETVIQPRGILSDIVGGIVEPINSLLSDGSKKVLGGIVEPIKGIALKIDSSLKPIYPGTQWCGSGNRARHAEDLGLFKLTDDCCRYHDECSDFIPAGETRHGLNNTGLFTRSHCDCDNMFYDCLKNANTFISKKIGHAYFNFLRPMCFKEEHPVVECVQYKGFVIKRCELYELNLTSPEIWQWFDSREF